MYFEKENQENEVEEHQQNCFRLNRKLKRFKNDIPTGIPIDKV